MDRADRAKSEIADRKIPARRRKIRREIRLPPIRQPGSYLRIDPPKGIRYNSLRTPDSHATALRVKFTRIHKLTRRRFCFPIRRRRLNRHPAPREPCGPTDQAG